MLWVGIAFRDIVSFERWSSQRSARIYFECGEVALLRDSQPYPPAVWLRLRHLAAMASEFGINGG